MLSAGTEQRRLAAIMFTDMVGYSALAQRNEALALELLEEHRSLLRSLFPRFNGREVKTIGDAFLVEFHSALEAAQCAIEIQRTLAKRNHDVPTARRIEVRIGIHIGDVVQRADGDVLGDGVNIASRIEPLAGPSGICVSVDVERQIRNTIEVSLVKLGATELKNIQVPMELFRIVLPWEKQPPAAQALPSCSSAVGPAGRSIVTLIGLLILAGGTWFLLDRRGAAPTPPSPVNRAAVTPTTSLGRIQSLAVLPLKNYSRDPEQDYFVDGMTDLLTTELGGISALRVTSHQSALKFKGSTKSMLEIGKELNADAVVEGSVQRQGSLLVINVQLIDARTDRHLWANSYERDVTNTLRLQREIAQAVAGEIKVSLTPQERERLAKTPAVNPGAQEAYLKGWQILREKRGTNWFPRSVELLQQAVDSDPNYALAYSALALAHGMIQTPLPAKEKMPKARAYALKALQLDDQLAEAHTHLAYVRFLYDWDWLSAEAGFKRALQLNPSYASGYSLYARYVMAVLGKKEDAIKLCQKAVQLAPLSPTLHSDLSEFYRFAGQYEAAIQEGRRQLELYPDNPVSHAILADAYAEAGMHEEALAEAKASGSPVTTGYVDALAGRRAEAQKILQELNEQGKEVLGTAIAAALGENDLAFKWLNKGFDARESGLVQLKVYPAYKNLRSDPRFTELARGIGLER